MMYKGTKRQRVWQHNSFLGHIAMGEAHMKMIIKSSTATTEAKETAYKIWSLYGKLSKQLKERVDAHQ